MTTPGIVVASNRGPVTLSRGEDGRIYARRGGGGLVTALTAALQRSGGLWIASAMSDLDREHAAAGTPVAAEWGTGHEVRYLAFDPRTFDRFYNQISNRVLWFVHHYLWELPRSPRWGVELRRAWKDYREVNRAFADVLAEQGDRSSRAPAYLIQDYHLSLAPALLRERRPDARIAHFSHSSFADAGYFRTLPGDIRHELLAGLLGADVLGFHTERWAGHFLSSCAELPSVRIDTRRRIVRWEGREVRVRVYPISIDPDALRKQADEPDVAVAERRLTRWAGGDRLVLRVDRTDLSKNILRGLLAFETLLEQHREWRGRVRHLALLNPSREALPEYRRYVGECRAAAARINERFSAGGWTPVRMDVRDDHPATMAGYRLYDVLLVNPVFDGMNLVAKEGPTLNRGDGVLVLSENAGAVAELGRHALVVNPFDVEGTARALNEALRMEPRERRRRAGALRSAIERNRLDEWVDRQLADLDVRDAT